MLRKTAAIIGLLLGLNGCVAHDTVAPDVSLAPIMITNEQSHYSTALERLGELLEHYNMNPIAMTVPPVINETGGAGQGQLPHDVTMMVESATQNIGEQVLVMPHDPRAIQSANNQGVPVYSVRGAITEFDAQTTSKRSGGQLGLFYKEADVGVEAEAEFESGTIAINFLIINQATRMYAPGVKATAKATIHKQSANSGFSFSILGNGFGLNGSTNVKTPIHHVLNLMIEYSMIQLVGKLEGVPYWLTIQGCDPDYRQIRRMGKDFTKMSPVAQVSVAQWAINKVNPNFKRTEGYGFNNKQKIQIIELKKQLKISPADSTITTELYLKLLSDGALILRKQAVMKQADEALNNVF